jgi:hypothetical protein
MKGSNESNLAYYFNLITKENDDLNTSSMTFININNQSVLRPGDVIRIIQSLLGMLTSFVCICIFIQKPILKSKSSTFKYLLAMSANDFVYMLCLIVWIILSKFTCIINKNMHTPHGLECSHFTLVYHIFISSYLTSAMALFDILLEIYLTLDRLFVIMNKKFPFKCSTTMSLIASLATFSLIFYSPILFLNRIAIIQNEEKYSILEYTEFGKSKLGKSVPIILSLFRFFLVSIVLLILNVITIVEFKFFHTKKNCIIKSAPSHVSLHHGQNNNNNNSASSRTNKNMTRMLILISFLYIICITPYLVVYSVMHHHQNQNQNHFFFSSSYFIHSISSIFLYSLIPMKFFIYVWFNRLFRKQFKIIFCYYCCCSY